ncbi:eukaryotic membrane protein family-domain-containing protein [Scheffersomyces amazonensis]|uniref:eukaryotic membrane protein family-domain-containing protein n=1 Tax=Scheffersomyces amazonensis TaxID=1078765 RepID=UPI00315CCE0F
MGRHRLSSGPTKVNSKSQSQSQSQSQSHGRRSEDSRSISRSRGSSISHSNKDRKLISIVGNRAKQLFNIKGKERLLSLYNLLLIELNLPNNTDNILDESVNNLNIPLQEVINMIKVPYHLEQFMIFGLMICFNSFLTLFTLAPLKIIISFIIAIKNELIHIKINHSISYKLWLRSFSWVKKDVVTLIIILISLLILSIRLDISRMYHEVRGEAHIKLYVIFGVLEVAEKLCSSLGQDIMNILYNIPIFKQENSKNYLKFFIFFSLAIFYVSFHTYILIYQTVSLNVAANSYSNALMALLLSNQFSELKSAVFKKFEREGLFQVAMADLTERFQLSFMLGIIAIRNLLQLNSTQSGLIPNSWNSWNTWFGATFGPGIVVIGSEIFVDWLKHCYISKFNKIRPRVYEKFLYVFSLDFLEVFNSNPDQHELTDYIFLTRRIGLPLLSSAVCFLRMTLPDLRQVFIFPIVSSATYAILSSSLLIFVTFITLLLVRLILGMVILKIANVIRNNHIRNSISQRSSKIFPTNSHSSKVKNNDLSDDQDIVAQSTPEPEYIVKEESPNSAVKPESPSDNSISIIDSSFFPGIPNTEASSINPNTRNFLYDSDEEIPPTLEETRNKKILNKHRNSNNIEEDEVHSLNKVLRYEMSSKRIW